MHFYIRDEVLTNITIFFYFKILVHKFHGLEQIWWKLEADVIRTATYLNNWMLHSCDGQNMYFS